MGSGYYSYGAMLKDCLIERFYDLMPYKHMDPVEFDNRCFERAALEEVILDIDSHWLNWTQDNLIEYLEEKSMSFNYYGSVSQREEDKTMFYSMEGVIIDILDLVYALLYEYEDEIKGGDILVWA